MPERGRENTGRIFFDPIKRYYLFIVQDGKSLYESYT